MAAKAAKGGKSKLAAVPDDAKSPRKPRKRSVATALKAGDISRLELLQGIRERLWRSASHADTHPRDLAALMKRLADVDHEIRTLDGSMTDPEGAPDDDDSDEGPAEDEAFDPASV